jgi:hypothetical protein
MISISIDGSVFGYSEQKSSDFGKKYKNYVIDLAEQEISELNTGYPAQVMGEYFMVPGTVHRHLLAVPLPISVYVPCLAP